MVATGLALSGCKQAVSEFLVVVGYQLGDVDGLVAQQSLHGQCTVPRREMQSKGIVEGHNVISNISLRLDIIGIVVLPSPLHLKNQEEALHHRVHAPYIKLRMPHLLNRSR